MPLPASGAISFNNINVELGLAATAQISLNDSAVRTLFGVASGAISMNQGYGKSNRVAVTVTLSANTTNYTLGTAQIPGYVAGITDVTLVVNSGVYVYSTNTANAGLTVAALAAGDTVSIVNNGFILGQGGAGGVSGLIKDSNFGNPGGPAMNINRAVSITNNSFIAGGGGGGAASAQDGTQAVESAAGGGGAGGGAGGVARNSADGSPVAGGAGGGPGLVGGRGVSTGTNQVAVYGGGGGGGRILPGGGGAANPGFPNYGGFGGGAGGGGGSWERSDNITGGGGGFGGSANAAGEGLTGAGAGGGGWGAAGGNAGSETTNGSGPIRTGGTGGKAINLNGNTATFIVTGTRYGAIS